MTQPARSVAPLEQRVEIETPEHVAFSYTVAGIGSRAAAAIVDLLIIGLLILGLWLAIFYIFATLVSGGAGKGMEAAFGAWTLALVYFATFLISWGYFVFFEALSRVGSDYESHRVLKTAFKQADLSNDSLAAARQLPAAGRHRRPELGGVLLLVAGAA